ncbi:mitochondrial ribosomal protein S6 [Xylocopa sonorina]|uniref:mitochondrial ribosomal protein S6 n=1 Tax=Xylocopa sonorina TaxID=1818115 RepID=UPI00403A94AF
MPTYEMPLLLRISSKAEYLNILRNVADSIFATGGFIRKIENWGEKELPCKAVAHGKMNTHAAHFMICFDIPPREMENVQDNCRRNLSIIRSQIFKQNEPDTEIKCTLEEEMLPPSYRPSVQKLLEVAKRDRSKKFKYNSGLDYYPFLK